MHAQASLRYCHRSRPQACTHAISEGRSSHDCHAIYGAVQSPQRREICMRHVDSILFVEDEVLLRDMVCEALEAEGFSLQCVETAVQALPCLTGERVFDALITDFALPGGVSGLDLALAAHERHPDMRIIVVSGHPAAALGQLPAGSVFLQKPYRIAQLLGVLQNG